MSYTRRRKIYFVAALVFICAFGGYADATFAQSCSISISPQTGAVGQARTLYWSVSDYVGTLDISGIGRVVTTCYAAGSGDGSCIMPPTSGSTTIYPYSHTTYTGTASDVWGGYTYCSYTAYAYPPASCSVSVTPNPKSYAGSATLSWSSSNAHYSVWINNVGYVGGSGSTTVAPYSNTDYSCYANGYGGSDGWHQYWLTVNPPASCSLPWGGSLGHGGSVTAYQTPSVPYNQTCNSQTRTCNNGSLSGNYNHASCTVSNPPPTATISVSPTSITQGQCTTVSWSSTNATSCTGTNFSTGGATSGSVQACPSQSTTYSCTCTRPGSSTVQCTGSGQGGVGAALTVSCTQAWSCTGGGGQTITRTNTDCSTTEIDTCITPNFCSGGSSSCVTPVSTGTISITPRVVRSGYTATVSWSTTNAASCSVSGNGNSWSGLTGTQTSSPISGKATYTLACDDGDADAVKDDLVKSASVYTAATFRED